MKRQTQRTSVFSLDLGTTKFCLAHLILDEHLDPILLDTTSVPAAGMRYGMLSDFSAAQAALLKLLNLAENQFQADIHQAVLSVSGAHVQSRSMTLTRPLPKRIVGTAELAKIVQLAEKEAVRESREWLHVTPVTYRVDQRRAVFDPVGFSGETLTCDFFVVDADHFYLKDLVGLCNECGLQVLRFYGAAFASAAVTVDDDRKNAGAVLLDMGGGITEGIVFKDRRPLASFAVNVAGSQMTNDLATCLNMSRIDAERLKVRYGLSQPEKDEVVPYRKIDGSLGHARASDIIKILTARSEELAAMITRKLFAFRGSLGGGVILTGGTAETRGLQPCFERVMNVPVSKLHPRVTTFSDHSTDPIRSKELVTSRLGLTPNLSGKFATAVGLLHLEARRLRGEAAKRQVPWSRRFLTGFSNWIREMS